MESLGQALKAMMARGELRLPAPTEESESDDAVAAQPACAICRDTHWLRRDLPPHHPDFGKLVRCTCSGALDASRLGAGLFGPGGRRDPEGLWSKTFENFAARDGTAEALEAAVAWSERPQGWLVLLGTTGSGKTHLLAACANALLASNRPARFWSATELLSWLKEGMDDDALLKTEARMQRVAETPTLILDDVGSERGTEWERQVWQDLILKRYRSALPMALSSNLTLDQLEAYCGSRIGSRLRDGWLCCVRGMSASDYRPQRVRAPLDGGVPE